MPACSCPTFLKSADPRRVGVCAKCGKRQPAGIRAHHPVVHDHFDRLRHQLQSGGVVAGSPTKPDLRDADWERFRYMCLQRIEKGAEEYGANNFRRPDIDLISEAEEETFDLAVYPLLEVVKNEPDAIDAVELDMAVYYAYRCYTHLRRYKAKLRGAV